MEGGLLGIIEYTSQSNDNTDFVPNNRKFKFIDDLSMHELICLLSQGLATTFTFKCAIRSSAYLPSENTNTQDYLKKTSKWTQSKEMKLNVENKVHDHKFYL